MSDYESVDSMMRERKEKNRPDAAERDKKSLEMSRDYIRRSEAAYKALKEHASDKLQHQMDNRNRKLEQFGYSPEEAKEARAKVGIKEHEHPYWDKK